MTTGQNACLHCGQQGRNGSSMCQTCQEEKDALAQRGENLSWAVGDHVCMERLPHIGGHVRGYHSPQEPGGPRIVQVEWGGRYPLPPRVPECDLRGLKLYKRIVIPHGT